LSPPSGNRQIVRKMKWAYLATPLLLLVVVEARQVEVEDVTARQLEAATQTEDVLAVFWCKYTLYSSRNSAGFYTLIFQKGVLDATSDIYRLDEGVV
jgi:hypothetical protein